MHFRIDPRVFSKYPSLYIGLIACHNIKNGSSPAELTAILKEAQAGIRSKFADPEQLKSHSTIMAWQEAHKAFGSNPNKFPSSIHALAKRVAKGGELPAINTLVDAYNVVSLRHMMPVGGEDLDCCSGDISLTFAEGNAAFTPLGGTENEPPELGEVIYKDDEGVLCRKFNWREAARTCLTEKTTNAVLVIEAIAPVTRSDLEAALKDLQTLVERFCAAQCTVHVLDGTSTACVL